jgi:hypothetical protein
VAEAVQQVCGSALRLAGRDERAGVPLPTPAPVTQQGRALACGTSPHRRAWGSLPVVEAAASPPAGPLQPAAAQPAAPEAAVPPAQTATFGRLEPAKVRDYWVDEARDFTPWLAKEENLGLLADTLGISLELVGTEQRVGPFKADIVAKDGEDTVIIENQLDPTDHKHLGQLLVYAAGRNAATVVWIAKQVTDEYRKVIDWLNEQTNVNFWALEI